MTADDFRRAALALPDAVEGAHMNHPDFRVGGKIFATLGYPDEEWGMVKLTPEEQAPLLLLDPKTYVSKGRWGEQGATLIHLATATAKDVNPALERAWQLAQAADKPKPSRAKRVARPRG